MGAVLNAKTIVESVKESGVGNKIKSNRAVKQRREDRFSGF